MNPEEARQLIENTDDLDTTYLGYRESQLGVEENIGVSDDKRLLHTLVVGPTGFGKTQTMVHAALQDLEKGRGLCVVVPKGDAITEVLEKMPEERLEDVAYINPVRAQAPGINVLEPHVHEEMNRAQKENQKEIIVSDLIDLFRRQSENWGDRFGRVLETLLRAYLNLNIHHDASKTLLDVFEAVTQQEKLTDLIDQVEDPIIREQLVRVKEDMGSYELEPLQRRLNDFVMNPTIRRVISAETSSIDFRDALGQNQVVLVDIQKGEVGETVAELIGSIVITKTWGAAQSRITQSPEDRTPFYLYVDELQNFAGEGSNFTKILSEAREYRLGCWLVTQYLRQLAPDMRTAVTNNCRNRLVFNPSGSDDTKRIADLLHRINQSQLKSLGKYRAALHTPGQDNQQPAVTFQTCPPWTTDRDTDHIKDQQAPTSSASSVSTSTSLGNTPNAGGEKHKQLLKEAKQHLEENGFQVNLLYQDQGEDKPDGHVILDDTTAHLEAEHTTLTKPAKVFQNLRRGHEQNREVIFAVEHGKATKLQNILTDPVNRRGADHEDTDGTYSYYTDKDGNPVTDADQLRKAEYRIIEIIEDDVRQHEIREEPDCPQLPDYTEDELENFCLHREDDGHCNELGQPCVLIE